MLCSAYLKCCVCLAYLLEKLTSIFDNGRHTLPSPVGNGRLVEHVVGARYLESWFLKDDDLEDSGSMAVSWLPAAASGSPILFSHSRRRIK